MFLVTTADQRFWKKGDPVLFLGEWCKLYSQRPVWGSLDHEVLSYHWDDRERLDRDQRYLNSLYENVLAQLGIILNGIHQEDHGTRYWRIIIGPWLYGFIGMLYDRYLSIQAAEATGKVTGTVTAEYNDGYWTPRDFNEFSGRFADDEYNHYLYSRIIDLASRLKQDKQDFRNIPKRPPAAERPAQLIKSVGKSLLNAYARMLPRASQRLVFVSTYFRATDSLRLQLALGQCPFLIFPKIEVEPGRLDVGLRSRIRLDPGDDFTGLLSQLMPAQIPQAYVESYQLLKKRALRALPQDPRIIFTANDHVHNECFKIWAACCTERGSLFIGTQHGGFEGMGRWFSLEDHQIRIWDRYYSWGWVNDAHRNIKPLPSGKLHGFAKIRPDRNGRILMVNTAFMRYSYFMQSMPVGASGQEAYVQGLFRLVQSLEERARELLTVRLYPHDFQDFQRERFHEAFPGIDCYKGSKTIYEQLQECRLFIGNNNGTTILEALAANVPSVIFLDPRYWEIRDSAAPYFEGLRNAGILHDSPASAAELVNRIYQDPFSWWHSPEVQRAKDAFCRRFARTSDTWLKEWTNELRSLMDSRLVPEQ